MSNGMKPGGKGPNQFLAPDNATQAAIDAERAIAAANALAIRNARQVAMRESGGASSTGASTTHSQRDQELMRAAYYQPKVGTAEVNWPPVMAV